MQYGTAGGVLNAFCIPCLRHQFKFKCLVTGFRPSSPSKLKLAQVKTCSFKETHICNRSIFCLASGPHHLRLARYRGPFYTQLAASSLGSRRPGKAKTLVERDINFIEESHSLVNISACVHSVLKHSLFGNQGSLHHKPYLHKSPCVSWLLRDHCSLRLNQESNMNIHYF